MSQTSVITMLSRDRSHGQDHKTDSRQAEYLPDYFPTESVLDDIPLEFLNIHDSLSATLEKWSSDDTASASFARSGISQQSSPVVRQTPQPNSRCSGRPFERSSKPAFRFDGACHPRHVFFCPLKNVASSVFKDKKLSARFAHLRFTPSRSKYVRSEISGPAAGDLKDLRVSKEARWEHLSVLFLDIKEPEPRIKVTRAIFGVLA